MHFAKSCYCHHYRLILTRSKRQHVFMVATGLVTPDFLPNKVHLRKVNIYPNVKVTLSYTPLEKNSLFVVIVQVRYGSSF